MRSPRFSSGFSLRPCRRILIPIYLRGTRKSAGVPKTCLFPDLGRAVPIRYRRLRPGSGGRPRRKLRELNWNATGGAVPRQMYRQKEKDYSKVRSGNAIIRLLNPDKRGAVRKSSESRTCRGAERPIAREGSFAQISRWIFPAAGGRRDRRARKKNEKRRQIKWNQL